MVAAVRRTDALDAESIVVGDAWVETVRSELRESRRRITGGWPGTVREARALTYAHFSARASALSPEDLERVARGAYRRARRQWLARSAR
jgi:hypothetical protein